MVEAQVPNIKQVIVMRHDLKMRKRLKPESAKGSDPSPSDK